MEAGDQPTIDRLVDHAVMAELILGAAEDEGEGATVLDEEGDRYLKGKVRYQGDDRLMDEQDEGVMMAWEAPLMQAHAQLLCGEDGDKDVLNVGFGMVRRPDSSHYHHHQQEAEAALSINVVGSTKPGIAVGGRCWARMPTVGGSGLWWGWVGGCAGHRGRGHPVAGLPLAHHHRGAPRRAGQGAGRRVGRQGHAAAGPVAGRGARAGEPGTKIRRHLLRHVRRALQAHAGQAGRPPEYHQ